MFPELRGPRLKEIAARVQDEFGGDLRAALVGSTLRVRKTLKSFPGIADPGADRILLFAGLAPVLPFLLTPATWSSDCSADANPRTMF